MLPYAMDEQRAKGDAESVDHDKRHTGKCQKVHCLYPDFGGHGAEGGCH